MANKNAPDIMVMQQFARRVRELEKKAGMSIDWAEYVAALEHAHRLAFDALGRWETFMGANYRRTDLPDLWDPTVDATEYQHLWAPDSIKRTT
jgi:hypothetical protein